MQTQILVYGWYGKGNLGDELFKDAFYALSPDCHFKFVNQITLEDIKKSHGVIFGGGSFLYKSPNVHPGVLDLLKAIPTAYIGVGIESIIDEVHKDIMDKSFLIASRTPGTIDKFFPGHPGAIFVPDIVRILPSFGTAKKNKSILVVPNIETISQWNSPSWSHLAWEKFKNEFAQFLDEKIHAGWKISFFEMCKNGKMDDHWATCEIISKMNYRSTKFVQHSAANLSLQRVSEIFSECSAVISQRYHGLILAENSSTPSVSIHHHDKLKNVSFYRGEKVPFYEFSKRPLHEAVDSAVSKQLETSNVDFTELRNRFSHFLKEVENGKVRRNSE